MFSPLYRQSMYNSLVLWIPLPRGFSRNNHIYSAMHPPLGGGTVGVVAWRDSSSDGRPLLSHLTYKTSSLKYKKGWRERQCLVPRLSLTPPWSQVCTQLIVLLFCKLQQPGKDKGAPEIPRSGLQIYIPDCISHFTLLISFQNVLFCFWVIYPTSMFTVFVHCLISTPVYGTIQQLPLHTYAADTPHEYCLLYLPSAPSVHQGGTRALCIDWDML